MVIVLILAHFRLWVDPPDDKSNEFIHFFYFQGEAASQS